MFQKPSTGESQSIGQTKKVLTILLITAVVLSLLFVAAQNLQGPTLLWTSQGSKIEVQVVRFPFESASRTYRLSAITDIGTTRTQGNERMIVFQYGNLDLQSPWQNSGAISDFDVYATALRHFVKMAHEDNRSAELRHYHRGFPLAVATLIAAALVWVLFFSIALLGPTSKNH
jgi:hypothetical protein